MTKIQRLLASSMVVVGVSASGCVTESDPAEPAPDIVYRTIVQVRVDGSLEQRTEAITVAQQQAEQATRTAYLAAQREGTRPSPQVILTDSGCAAADLWLFDQPSITGNELCLFRSGLDPLGDELEFGRICRTARCGSTWDSAIRSIWAGSDQGFFFHCTPTLCFTMPMLHFTPFQRIDNVGTNPYNWVELLPP